MGQCSSCCGNKDDQKNEIASPQPDNPESLAKAISLVKIQSAIRTYLSTKRANEIYESLQKQGLGQSPYEQAEDEEQFVNPQVLKIEEERGPFDPGEEPTCD